MSARLKDTDICVRCITTGGGVRRAAQICCSTHDAPLCHRCYRLTHFVEVCASGCRLCAAVGLPITLQQPPRG